jgi:hypothetical protein
MSASAAPAILAHVGFITGASNVDYIFGHREFLSLHTFEGDGLSQDVSKHDLGATTGVSCT